MTITRRGFLASSLPAGLWAAGLSTAALAQQPRSERFQHGVASGDPDSTSVILWTRIQPHDAGDRPRGEWVVARDRSLRDVVQSGEFSTGAERDWTVKINASDLESDAWYWYGFRCDDEESPVGHTRTLPAGSKDQLRLAVFSCSNLPFGYFNSYGAAAAREDLDLAVHLGDYIYEYSSSGYGAREGARLGRISDPTHEILSLDDYRRRYAQYRNEPELQAIHAAMPMVVVWDDHEIANNTWHSGAENHDPNTEGSFANRRAAAIQAFHEWLPIRSRPASSRDRIYRTLDLGDLASLIMLDTRLIGRDQQLDYADVARDRSGAQALEQRIDDPQRSMLGARQEAWLKGELARSRAIGAPWQILGQQLLLGNLITPRASDLLRSPNAERGSRLDFMSDNSLPLNLDAWDGYGPARERLAQDSLAFGNNVVALAGDTHNSWAFDLQNAAGRQYGVELGTTSISSPGLEGSFDPEGFSTRLRERNPGLRFANLQDRGYMTLTVSREAIETEWLYVDTIESQEFVERPGGKALLEATTGAGTAPLQIL